jgi:hypothetical protein
VAVIDKYNLTNSVVHLFALASHFSLDNSKCQVVVDDN